MTAKFWIGGTGTWDNTNDLNWSLTTGGANNTTHPVAGDTVTLDGASGGGTVTVNATLAMTTLTTSAFTGTLDFSANNNNIAISTSWSDAATGVHTVNMGNGTWTFSTTSGTVLSIFGGANLTFNANSSNILLSATPSAPPRTLGFTSRTLNNVTVTNAAWSASGISFTSASGTIAGALTLTNVGYVQFASAGGLTFSGAFTYDGTPTNQGLIFVGNTAHSLSVAAANILSWVFVQGITKAGAGSITVNNGFDGGGNTGVTINMPQRLLGGGMSGGMRG